MQYKFRGKRVDNGEWVYGNVVTVKLCEDHDITGIVPFSSGINSSAGADSHMIVDGYYTVHPDSVGMWTGLKDKAGVEVYEGDLVMGVGKIEPRPIGFDEGCFGYDSDEGLLELDFEFHMEVIGNTTDNPELLKEERLCGICNNAYSECTCVTDGRR